MSLVGSYSIPPDAYAQYGPYLDSLDARTASSFTPGAYPSPTASGHGYPVAGTNQRVVDWSCNPPEQQTVTISTSGNEPEEQSESSTNTFALDNITSVLAEQTENSVLEGITSSWGSSPSIDWNYREPPTPSVWERIRGYIPGLPGFSPLWGSNADVGADDWEPQGKDNWLSKRVSTVIKGYLLWKCANVGKTLLDGTFNVGDAKAYRVAKDWEDELRGQDSTAKLLSVMSEVMARSQDGSSSRYVEAGAARETAAPPTPTRPKMRPGWFK